MNVRKEIQDKLFIAGFVVVRGVTLAPSGPELKSELRELIEQRLANPFPEQSKTAVRDLLRRGGFSPSGRNKPCNEYLVNAARENRFPEINNVVDVVNTLSLHTGLPLCVQDYSVTGPELTLRYGEPGEKYVFNSSGQEIDLKGLICLCKNEPGGGTIPVSNPIKDSMLGKITAQTRDLLGIVYATREVVSVEQLRVILEHFQTLWVKYAGGTAEPPVLVQ